MLTLGEESGPKSTAQKKSSIIIAEGGKVDKLACLDSVQRVLSAILAVMSGSLYSLNELVRFVDGRIRQAKEWRFILAAIKGFRNGIVWDNFSFPYIGILKGHVIEVRDADSSPARLRHGLPLRAGPVSPCGLLLMMMDDG